MKPLVWHFLVQNKNHFHIGFKESNELSNNLIETPKPFETFCIKYSAFHQYGL